MNRSDNAFSRRNLVGAAAIYKLTGAAPQLKAAPANEQIGFGFIGTGIRGTQLMAEFLEMPAVKPVMVADLYDGYLQRAKEQTEGRIETTKDYRAVLDRKDVDAVVIATPDHWHKQMTLEALSAGKHVYIEKPMTWSIDEGPAIIAAAKKSGKTLMVGSGAKTSALTAKSRELIKAGAIGKVNLVRMVNHRNDAQGAWVYPVPPDASPQTIDWKRFLGPSPKRDFDANVFFRWRCWWEYSGGVATDLFVHMLCQLHEVMDVEGPNSVVSQGGLYRWKDGRTVPDLMNSIYQYDGFVADLCVNLCNGYATRGMIVMGDEGTLVEERGKVVIYPERKPPEAQSYGTRAWPKAARAAYFEARGFTADGRPKSPPAKTPQPKEIVVEAGPSHTEWFLRSLREGIPSKENAEEGHFAAGAAHLANVAYREGRRATWDRKSNRVNLG